MKTSKFYLRIGLFINLGIMLSVISHANPLMNQLGFFPKAKKQIVIPSHDASDLEVHTLQGERVLKLKAPNVNEWEYSGEETELFDISAVNKVGTYRLFRNGEYLGNLITIGNDVYRELSKASLKWFYYQRAGMDLEPRYAGKWARALGHKDNQVIIYGTDKNTGGQGEGQKIDAPKGWYDAGDYGKYIVNSGITVWTLLELYERFPEYTKNLNWDIPREYPQMPALLEEVRYNLDWMLSMQDKDGSIFHKVSTLKFCGSVMPEIDTSPRYAILKSVTAALDFAGVMAQASVVYRNYDEKYADKMLKAAKKAYEWAKNNPHVYYHQPENVNTGSYAPKGESSIDEFRFAAAELFFAESKTGKTTEKKSLSYLEDLKKNPFTHNGVWWGDLNMLSVFRVAFAPDIFEKDLVDSAKKIIIEEGRLLKNVADSSGYGVPIHPWNWNWGSNSTVANNGILLLHAYLLTKDESFLDGAQQALDYLLGRNPMDISYVTGFGFRSPLHPHHRPSEADGVDSPVPGMLVGGPHLGKQDININGVDKWKCPNYASQDKPALAYLDDRCSYATNEVAINWNAPLAFLVNALEAIYNEK